MRYMLLVLFLFSCVSKRKYIDVMTKPSKTEMDQYKRIKPTSGQENQKRYLYYNSLQFKNKYRRD